jgi:hypothetical protein
MLDNGSTEAADETLCCSEATCSDSSPSPPLHQEKAVMRAWAAKRGRSLVFARGGSALHADVLADG